MMERKGYLSEETIQAAKKFLDANMEMLHDFPPDEYHCRYCNQWRAHTRFDAECPALLRVAILEVERRETSRCVQLCVNEYARWKDVDIDSYGIAVGAIGAASNILCAIEKIPAVADPPIHINEYTSAASGDISDAPSSP
jgi:hypothetical protein